MQEAQEPGAGWSFAPEPPDAPPPQDSTGEPVPAPRERPPFPPPPRMSPPGGAGGPAPEGHEPPAALRLEGYPGVPLTAAPMRPWWTLAFALGVIAINAGLAYLSSAPLTDRLLEALGRALAQAGPFVKNVFAAVFVLGVSILPVVVPLAIPAAIAWKRHVRLREVFGLRAFRVGPAIVTSLVVMLAGVFVSAAWGALMMALKVKIHGTGAEMWSVFGKSAWGTAVLVALVVVIAPFLEELLMRGVVFASLREAWGDGRAVVLSAVIFGVLHLYPSSFVPTAFLGVALALSYRMTRSLWVPVMAHSAYNLIVLVLGLAAAPLR